MDAITIQILRNKIASLVDEMHYHFYRSGYSTIIRESRDFSCVIVDREGRLPRWLHVFETADNSAFGVVNASTVDLDESAAGFVAGDYVKVENSSVFILLAPRVSGDVKAVLTLPAAFALGAGYYLARRLMMRLSRRSDS